MQKLLLPSKSDSTSTIKTLKNALEYLIQEDLELEKYSVCVLSPNKDGEHELIPDLSILLSELSWKNGSIITITRRNKSPKTTKLDIEDNLNDYINNGIKKTVSTVKTATTTSSKKNKKFIPFPELAKDYESAIRKAKIHRLKTGTSSFNAMADISSSLHVIEPQSTGPIRRIYLCSKSAERFQAGCYRTTTASGNDRIVANRCGILFGTIQRERIDPLRIKRPKTSLSSTTDSEQYCTVAKVHAIYEPPDEQLERNNNHNLYNSVGLFNAMRIPINGHKNTNNKDSMEMTSVLRIANWLKLRPVGWIFTYDDSKSSINGNKSGMKRTIDEDSLPVLAHDIVTGSHLQIQAMKHDHSNNNNNDETSPYAGFCTIAMDSNTGTTEAFQLSDVTVQMVSEEMFVMDNCESSSGSKEQLQQLISQQQPQRYVTTKHPVIVDGKETTRLDTVFCLINTALLSLPSGMYAGGYTSSKKKKTQQLPVQRTNGKLTSKTKKMIVKEIRLLLEQQQQQQHAQSSTAFDSNSNESMQRTQPVTTTSSLSLLELLCDFHILVAIDVLLTQTESKQLCETIYKFARGQKNSARIDIQLLQKLLYVLDK